MRDFEIILIFWVLIVFFGSISAIVIVTRTSTIAPTEEKTAVYRKRPRDGLSIAGIFHSGFTLFGVYFITITIAELLVIFVKPLAGLICHSVILFLLLIQPIFMQNAKQRDLLTAMSLIPLIRIMSLAMPLVNLPQILWFPLIYFPLLIACIITMKTIAIKPSEVGIVSSGLYWQIPGGLVLGVVLGIVESLILQPEPMVRSLTLNDTWLMVLIIFLTTGMVEELIFRGILQKLAENVRAIGGILYVSAIFAVLHVGFYSLIDVIFVFLVAIIFAAIVKRTGSLVGVTLAHGMTNTVLFVIGPFILS